MAITKSAKKAIRNSEKKRVFNLRRKRGVDDVLKDIKKAISTGDVSGAEKMLSGAYKQIDKSAKMNTIKKNNASRKKSRLSAMIKRAKTASK
jgi:small subunit ribosomal protein S20